MRAQLSSIFFQHGKEYSDCVSRSTSLRQNRFHVTDSLEKLQQYTWGKMVHVFAMEVMISQLYTKHQTMFGLLPFKK